MKFRDAVPGGLSVGTPGVLRMLKKVHKRHGRLPWRKLFRSAIKLSKKGFYVSPRLNALLQKAKPETFGEQARAYFFDENNQPRPVGYKLKNPDFAKTLAGIAKKGPDFFYRGELATKIAETVQNSKTNKGDMIEGDLNTYQAMERPPVCVSYRGYKVCGMGPPLIGHVDGWTGFKTH